MEKSQFFSSGRPFSRQILASFKLKAFADDKLNVTSSIKFVFHMIKKIVGKRENAG